MGFFFFFFFLNEKNPVYRDRTHAPTCQKVTRLPLSYPGDRLQVLTFICISQVKSNDLSHSIMFYSILIQYSNLELQYIVHSMYVCMYGHHILWQSMDQPGKVANPAPGQLNRENEYCPVPVRA